MPNERISVETSTSSVFGKMPVTTVMFFTSLYNTDYKGVRTMFVLHPEANLSHGELEQLAMETQQQLRNMLTPSLNSGRPVDTDVFKAFQRRIVELAGTCTVEGKDFPQNSLLMCLNLGYSH